MASCQCEYALPEKIVSDGGGDFRANQAFAVYEATSPICLT